MMIGLGSNRLTVCRRGGQDLYYAGGYGGMRLVTSPYSAQATAALKAQFPTQWPTIRDYGFAHPALVPFINEDPMMVCSLGIEGLPIRWLYSSGTGYIVDDSLYLNGSMRIETKIIWDGYKRTYNHCVYGPNNNSGSGGTDEYCRYLLLSSGGSGKARFVYSNLDDNVVPPSVNTPIVIVDNAGTLYYDGVVKKTNTERAFTCRSPFGIFYVWGGGRANGIKMSYLKITDNGAAIREFVPFISKTQGCGFLDLTNLVFYPNRVSGEGKDFTISESPS